MASARLESRAVGKLFLVNWSGKRTTQGGHRRRRGEGTENALDGAWQYSLVDLLSHEGD